MFNQENMRGPRKLSMPKDVHPDSRCRLPLPVRGELDEACQVEYDRATGRGTLAGLRGPAGLALHSPATAPLQAALNKYLRFEAGFTPRVREIAILATAREMDSAFEWAAHEPEALKVGVSQEIIDAIGNRGSPALLDEEASLVIELARQVLRTHRVDSELFRKLHMCFGTRKLIDLLGLMGNYASTAILLAAVNMQVPDAWTAQLPLGIEGQATGRC